MSKPVKPGADVTAPTNDAAESSDFVRDMIQEDVSGGSPVHTRFPPEPNGYLHVGHAKSICLNFGVAEEFGGRCNLRFDDTNPLKEDTEYVESIEEDVRWLGFDPEERIFYASDYFETLYEWAVLLIKEGKAYVDSVSADDVGAYRGLWHEAGKESPYRGRTVEENLDLFERMRAGEFEDGAHVLRAKIDMASGNMNLRDPVMYRIRHTRHHRTGDDWCIYPTYDWAHGQSDAIEAITHSLCTLEFEDHRPLYDWYLDSLVDAGVEFEHRPRQTEFAKLKVSYTMLSKRRLIELVESGHVDGWDDPRMPTLAGLRRRGYPAAALRDFCGRIGLTKRDTTTDLALLEHCARELLNREALRRMAVLRPVKLVIENYPEGQSEEMELINNPEDESAGTRKVPFSRELWIEEGDFMIDPPKKFFRMGPGREVRLRSAYLITCTGFEQDETGRVTEVRATYDPETRGGSAPDGRRVKGTLHWLSAAHSVPAEFRLYEPMFEVEDPGADDRPLGEQLRDDSKTVLEGFVEPALQEASVGEAVQFERTGYFAADPDGSLERPVFNRIVSLRDTWAKVQRQQKS